VTGNKQVIFCVVEQDENDLIIHPFLTSDEAVVHMQGQVMEAAENYTGKQVDSIAELPEDDLDYTKDYAFVGSTQWWYREVEVPESPPSR